MAKTLNNERKRPAVGVLAGWQLYEGIIPHTFYLSLLNGIRSAALEHDCHLYIACGMGQVIGPGGIHPAWPVLSPDTDFVPVGPWNTDGLIMVMPFLSNARKHYIQQLVSEGHPIVCIGSMDGCSAVVTDNEGGIHQAFGHLVGHGHRRIAFIAGHTRHESDSDARLTAYQSAIIEYSAASDSRLVAYGSHNRASGRRAMMKILESGVEFSAVIASNDESAIGAMGALHEAGRRIPKDVAVIGFDDRPQALAQIPPLTTIHYPMVEMGYRALELLLLHIEEPTRKTEIIREPAWLIPRQSCGCLPDSLTSNVRGSCLQQVTEVGKVSIKRVLVKRMFEEVSSASSHLQLKEIRVLCRNLVNAYTSSLEHSEAIEFYSALMELVQCLEKVDEDTHTWQALISTLHSESTMFMMKQNRLETYRQSDEMLDQARIILSESTQRRYRRQLLKQDEMTERMGVLTARLMAANSEVQILRTLEESLSEVGIINAWIAFFEPKNDDPVAESFLQVNQGTGPNKIHFCTRQFPPPELCLEDKPMHLALLPLTFQHEVLGFVVFDASNLTPCAAIVRQLAAALKSARLHAQVVELSLTDSLTGLHNRRYMDLFIQNEVARSRRYKRELSVIMIDIDHFKKYNDSFGHPAGDEALERVAGCIQRECRRGLDFVSRYGGEEFIVVLPETGASSAIKLAETIRTSIADLENIKRRITVSVGVAALEGSQCNPEELIRRADQALYQAKHMGRNQSCIFDEIFGS
jgi:diguanylate cyclase (GGDEF)-like protein